MNSSLNNFHAVFSINCRLKLLLFLTTCTRAQARTGSRYPFLTSKERDIETGLDYFINRYYSSTQGRFTSPDVLSGRPGSPQSWNRYAYSINNPLKYIDPSGLWWYTKDGGDGHPQWFDDDPGRVTRAVLSMRIMVGQQMVTLRWTRSAITF